MQLTKNTPILKIIKEMECISCPMLTKCSINDMQACIKIYNDAGKEE